MSFELQVTRFLNSYLRIPAEYKDQKGIIDAEHSRVLMSVLVAQGVFECFEEIREEALKDYGIILPWNYFKLEVPEDGKMQYL